MATTTAGEAKPSRLAIVDGLRGYALFGLFLVHMTGYFELYNARPVPSLVQDWVLWLFLGKSFTLLAVCFGFSFFIMMEGGRRRGQPFAGRFAWRLFLLLVIGWLHSLIYRGDIIAVLATAGFFLIPFDKVRSNRTLLIVAGLLLLQPFLIYRILAGLMGYDWALAEPLFYDDGGAMRPSLFGTLGEVLQANLVAGKFSKWAFYIETGADRADPRPLPDRARARPHPFLRRARAVRARPLGPADPFDRRRLPAFLAARSHLLPQPGAGLLDRRDGLRLDRSGRHGYLAARLRPGLAVGRRTRAQISDPPGRMTLTLYIGQSLVFVPVYYGFGLHLWDRITQPESLALALVAFAAQLVFATIWFRHFVYGPLEWVWRAGMKLSFDVPFRLRQEPLKASPR